MKFYNFENMLPSDLEQVLRAAPVAYIPMGTLEFHGWHMPFGFDALKAKALCELSASKTGGVVLPPTYFGFAGGHKSFPGSIISEEALVLENLRITHKRLAEMGFRILVTLTGHYPGEQMEAVKRVSEETSIAFPHVKTIGLAEPEAFPDEFRGDHAGQWETSISLYLLPDLVKMSLLDANETPLHGICGQDPRTTASTFLGEETVKLVVETIAQKVQFLLQEHHSGEK